MHILTLHVNGSGNPLGITSKVDKIPIYPYITIKDIYGIGLISVIYLTIVIIYPNLLGHSDNYIPANPLVTPNHISPEIYILPIYAILRAIPSKLGGVMGMGGAILVLLLLPILDKSSIRSNGIKPISKLLI
jgi:quinol-cytochrome oxidoreductase complex cytochrome b subunit